MTKARILADYVAGGTTAAEFDYMDGVTSNVQTQLDRLPDQGEPHIIPGVLYPAVAGNDLDGTDIDTSHGSTYTYGTAHADGRMYYYTDIKGSKPIKDPRIGGHFGSQRYEIASIQLLEQETATHGSNVYSIDGRKWMRCTGGGWSWINDGHGSRLKGGNVSSYANMYIEVVGYFNGINTLAYTDSAHKFRYTLDGGSEVATDFGNTVIATPLGSRFVDPSSLTNIPISTTLGIHTIKLRSTGVEHDVHGIELIAQDTTSTATKSQIQIPSQNVVSAGKKFTVSGTPHYNPFAFAGDGTTAVAIGDTTSHGKVADGWTGSTATYFDSTLDTATSLGLSAWETGGDFYRPVNGGRVVRWVDSSGSIKTSVNMMPPCATAIVAGSDASLPTSHAWTSVYQPKIKSGSIDHSQAEVAKTFHWREFGNGAANGGTGATYADASMLSGTDDIAYVMDDGLTSLTADNALCISNADLRPDGPDDYWYLTFIGTGITIKTTSYAANTYHIAQNLPYGTHILKGLRDADTTPDYTLDGVALNDVTGGTYGALSEATFHQPKKPPIPEDCVVLADYMLMADFVAVDAIGIEKISKGVRRVDASRDIFYDGNAAVMDYNDISYRANTRVYLTTDADGSPNSKVSIPSFGRGGIVSYASASDKATNINFKIDGTLANGTTNYSHYHDGTPETDGTFTEYHASYLLGKFFGAVHKTEIGSGGVELTEATASKQLSFEAIDLVSPIHTSHHYQTFETPYLHELVGGDRNMEQTNLVVTPDGKTWDEVTRDVSYLGPKHIFAIHDTDNVSGDLLPAINYLRGGFNPSIQAAQKGFIIAYNNFIAPETGHYGISGYFRYDSSTDEKWFSVNSTVSGSDINIKATVMYNAVNGDGGGITIAGTIYLVKGASYRLNGNADWKVGANYSNQITLWWLGGRD